MDVLQSALTQGITPAIVIAIYLIITKILDNKKETQQIKITSDITKSINLISDFIVSLTKNIVDKDKDKCKNAIEDSMYSASMRIINFVVTTIINNHIDINKNIIISNVHNIINAEYYTVYSTLSLYKIEDKKASDYLNKEWMNDIEKDILDIIYNDKLSKEDKILSFSNKLNLKFKNYITYITNNVIA